ncbi:MAG: nucleotidyltransferase family protein [Pseudomonadota bacterium]
MSVAGIVLAAGASRRFGGCKALAPWAGTTLLGHTATEMQRALGRAPLVVTGAWLAPMLGECARHALPVVFNPYWQSGQASSLRAAIDALPQSVSSVLLSPVDLPRVSAADFSALLQAYSGAAPVATDHSGAPGAPAVFPRAWFGPLRNLTGDQGARRLLERQAHVEMLVLRGAAFDVDTKHALAALARN